MADDALEDLARRFRRFALKQALPSSPLYSRLALAAAEDLSILRLAREATSSPVTSLFFAAVHDLLLRGVEHPLRLFYPDLTPDPFPDEHAFPAFCSFCYAYAEDIRELLTSRRVQTNEVRRCLYLAPGFEVVAREAGPYSVIDVGSSAGLHLLWHRFGYHYDGRFVGAADSAVQLTCCFVGDLRPCLPQAWSEPVRQLGIDLHPLDPARHEDQRWLRALIWPEHFERADLLEQTLAVAREDPPCLVAGDALSVLPEVLHELPPDETCCVCHNHTLNQWSDVDRARFDAMLGEFAMGRIVYRLSAEWLGTEKPEFVLSRYRDGRKSQRLLARVDDFGAWVQWADG
jgi:hypothetical protein